MTPNIYYGASLVAQMVKYQPAKQGPRFNPWVGKIPREGNGNPVFLPGKFHGQRNLVGYHPRGHNEMDTTEQLTFSLSVFILCLPHGQVRY